jgi:hypothetical protein
LLALSVALWIPSHRPIANACATFATLAAPERGPSLSLERVLIIHDPASETEHFVREVVFRSQGSRFGFVIPTPSMPSVFAVAKSPFRSLEQSYPFAPRVQAAPARVRSATLGLDDEGVEVVEQKSVGSFTAFVLRARDATSLQDWLQKNELGSTPANDAWLAEYITRDSYFVALRYEPPANRSASTLRAETLRITFKTPVAYYPYREPQRAHDAKAPKRAVALWLVSPEALTPLARVASSTSSSWVQPFAEGQRVSKAGPDAWARIVAGLGIDLPAFPSFVVQTFEDQKRSRAGFSDAVFVPAVGVAAAQQSNVASFVAKFAMEGAL